MPGVQVTFGANIQPLVDGVKDARSAIDAFMAAFAGDKIAGFVEQYAKLGEQIEIQGRQFGESALQVQELGYVAKMAGGDQEELAASFGRFEQTLQRAQNPTSQQALALRALGLSAKELIGLPLPQQLGIVADAFAKYGDGTNKAAVAQALFRNSSGALISALDGGRAGLQALYDQAISTGAVLSGPTVKSLSDLDHATVAARAAFSGLAGTMLGEVAGALTSGIKGVTDFVGSITLAVDAGKFWEQQFDGIKYAMDSLVLSIAHGAQMARDFFHMDWSAVAADWKRAEQEQQDLLRQHEAQMAAIAAAGKAEIVKQMAPEDAGKPQAPAIATNATNELAQQKSAIQEQIKYIDDFFAQEKEGLAASLAAHKLSYDQETAALIADIRERDSAEQAQYAKEIADAKAAEANWEAVEKQKVAAHDKAMLEISQATDKAAKQDAREWQSALQPVVSAWNSQLRAMLSGTETFGQAMKKIFADLAISAIEKLESIGVDKLSQGLAGAFGGGPQSMITSLLGGGGQAAAQTANTTALTTLTAAITANTAAVTGSAATGAAGAPLNLLSGAAGAGGGGGGLFSGLFGGLQSLLSGAGGGLSSLFSGAAGGLSSLFSIIGLPFGFAVGTDSIRSGGLAILHPGETVIPAARGSGPFTGAGLGGGDTHNHYWNISAVDGTSMQRWLGAGGARQIANSVAGVQSITPSMSWD